MRECAATRKLFTTWELFDDDHDDALICDLSLADQVHKYMLMSP